ncbi:lipase family protein [Nocardia pseudovaccinii]|uniref:lipase family protein n=1 Tax=Nocardia pseudovaccinii TaxID=189540 RepID=UPI0007A38C92
MSGQRHKSAANRRRPNRFGHVVAVVSTLSLAAVVACAGPGQASAEPTNDFYLPPAQFDATRGAVVKTVDTSVYLAQPTDNGKWPIPAKQVMYTTRTEDDAPVAATGIFIDSDQPWRGSGPRPTVIIAPGTTGQGDQCAMSLAFATGVYARVTPPALSVNQEALAALAWNSLGARVFVTDYIGMGTPGIHTYVNRIEEAHAVLDGARAANALSGSGTDTPLAFWGYSQGGGATAAAAEMQSGYAPELNLKGTWAGAPTADLSEILRQVDGVLISGVTGFAVNGILARHPELQPQLDARTAPEGKALLRELADECIADVIFLHPFMRSADLTVDHRTMSDHLREIPELVGILDRLRIGSLKPTSPVFITSGRNDDTVPYGQARQLATDWCGHGATVTFRTNELPPILPGATIPNHFGPELIDGYGTNNAIGYLVDRLNGIPVTGCTID